MKPRAIPGTCRAAAATPDARPWRVVTHYTHGAPQHCIVQWFTAYELALHAYRRGLDQLDHQRANVAEVELRDPSGRLLMTSSYGHWSFKPVDDGLLNAPPGRYVWHTAPQVSESRFRLIGYSVP